MIRRWQTTTITLMLVAALSLSVVAIRWSPNELDVVQDPATTATYLLQLQNESDESAQVNIYVSDWQRDEDGVNDLSLPRNGARWILERAFSVGDTAQIRYAVRLPFAGTVGVDGSFRSWTPQVIDGVTGPVEVAAGSIGDGGPTSGGTLSVHRSIESVDASGIATILLEIRSGAEFYGLTIEETFAQGVEVTGLEDAGARFDTINRSSADWVTASADQVALAPGESREIELAVTTPQAFNGTYWCIVHAESQALQVIGEVSGTQIVSRPSVGLKVLVTAAGTEIMTGEVVDVRVVEAVPLTIQSQFRNTGNVQHVVTAEAEVIDTTGTVVARLMFSEFGRDYFRILPGSTRMISMSAIEGTAELPSGIYQAVVSFDFGGDSLVVGVKGFRVP